jgi:hypothetical protein
VRKEIASLMYGVLKFGLRASPLPERKLATRGSKTKGGSMKKLFALVALALCMSASSFGANVVGHSAEVAGKDTYRVATISAKDAGKATKAVVQFLF